MRHLEENGHTSSGEVATFSFLLPLPVKEFAPGANSLTGKGSKNEFLEEFYCPGKHSEKVSYFKSIAQNYQEDVP